MPRHHITKNFSNSLNSFIQLYTKMYKNVNPKKKNTAHLKLYIKFICSLFLILWTKLHMFTTTAAATDAAAVVTTLKGCETTGSRHLCFNGNISEFLFYFSVNMNFR